MSVPAAFAMAVGLASALLGTAAQAEQEVERLSQEERAACLRAGGHVSDLVWQPKERCVQQIEGVWKVERNPFQSKADITFGSDTFNAHFGGYSLGGRYSAEGETLKFWDVIEMEGGMAHREMHSPKAWSYWRQLNDGLLSSTRFHVQADRLTVEGPSGGVTFKRTFPDGP